MKGNAQYFKKPWFYCNCLKYIKTLNNKQLKYDENIKIIKDLYD